MTRRTRAKADYLVFLGAREWPILVAGLGVLLGAITIMPSAVGSSCRSSHCCSVS
jgi:hypothetical protein